MAEELQVSDKNSTYFVIGRLRPAEYCANFNPGELDFGDGWILDVYYDLICIWSADVSHGFQELLPGIREKFHLVTDLFAFRTERLISYELQNWVEARDTESRKNMIGAFLGDESTGSRPRRNSRPNVSWKRAAQKADKINSNPQLRLAIKDYVAALRDPGDDAFFFAYRAIENSCRSISGVTGQCESSDWTRMHRLLGTSKRSIQRLTDTAKDIRHGAVSGQAIQATGKPCSRSHARWSRRPRESWCLAFSSLRFSRHLTRHCY